MQAVECMQSGMHAGRAEVPKATDVMSRRWMYDMYSSSNGPDDNQSGGGICNGAEAEWQDECGGMESKSKLKSTSKSKSKSKSKVKREPSPVEVQFDANAGRVYRAIRPERVALGWSQSPCGACPQFEFCHDDGPVNARECQYYSTWLNAGIADAD